MHNWYKLYFYAWNLTLNSWLSGMVFFILFYFIFYFYFKGGWGVKQIICIIILEYLFYDQLFLENCLVKKK